MTLYAEGRITAAQLEAYRVAAADDRQGPGQVLDAHGLAVPEDAAPAGEAAIRTLISAADAYLATLDGPGVTDVRSGIAKWHDGPVTAARPASSPASSPASHPVVATHLPAALAALQGTHPALAAAISGAAPHLTWIAYDGYDPAAIGQAFAQGHAYASIIGESGSAVPAHDFDLGIFLIAPHVLYRDRCHAAPELYAPLTGPHGWRFAPGDPLTIRPAHTPVWNPPHQPHLTKVGPVPFLCLFGWTRDVQETARVIPADDWPELEALRLG